MLHQALEFKLTEVGIYVEGNVVTHEYVIEETLKEGKLSLPSVAVAEIKNGKVQRIRSYHDRLAVAKQLATGVVATRVVNSIINRMEKGLR
jgi:limonene-1,2-epoxide hydrolase